MRITRLVLASMIFFTMLLNYSPTKSFACSCAQPAPVQDELNRSSAVFSGKVIDKLDVNKNNVEYSSADPIAYVFEVKEIWKGLDQTQVIVTSERDSASCGYEFALNGEYLVYAQERDGKLTTSVCSRTTLLASATTDLDELGFGEEPTVEVTIDLTDRKGEDGIDSKKIEYYNPFYLLLLVGGLTIGIVFGIVLFRKRKK